MKFIIHYNGKYEDSIVIIGDDIEEIREKAKSETSSRGWDEKHCWSEKIQGRGNPPERGIIWQS